MARASTTLERLTKLEVISIEQSSDIKEIKADVKLLLETKWKAEGKRMGVSAIVAAIISLLVPFLAK